MQADESQVRHAETADRLRDIYLSYGHTLKEKNTLLLDSAKAGFTVVRALHHPTSPYHPFHPLLCSFYLFCTGSNSCIVDRVI